MPIRLKTETHNSTQSGWSNMPKRLLNSPTTRLLRPSFLAIKPRQPPNIPPFLTFYPTAPTWHSPSALSHSPASASHPYTRNSGFCDYQ